MFLKTKDTASEHSYCYVAGRREEDEKRGSPAAKLRVCLARKIRRTDAGSLPALVRMRSRLHEHAQERGELLIL